MYFGKNNNSKLVGWRPLKAWGYLGVDIKSSGYAGVTASFLDDLRLYGLLSEKSCGAVPCVMVSNPSKPAASGRFNPWVSN